MTKKRLPLLTFIAVLLAITATGILVVPFIARAVDRAYIELQSDINERQAKAFGRFAEERLAQGTPRDTVLAEVQAMLEGSSNDRGYSCVVDQSTARFLGHPMSKAIGMLVSSKQASFESPAIATGRDRWETFITKGVSAAGILFFPQQESHVVYMYSLPEVGWTISTHENTERVRAELATMRKTLYGGAGLIGLILAFPASAAARRVGRRYESTIEERNRIIDLERGKSDKLLLNILPEKVAAELKSGKKTIAERHASATVLFADIVGFTPLASELSAEELVTILNRIFSEFDDLATKHKVEKIKTIGDAYMVCSGLPEAHADDPQRIAEMALDMIAVIDSINNNIGRNLEIRIGIHTGDVVAGIIGKQKFIYDLWGDTVNIASHMESSGTPGRIHISESTRTPLDDSYTFEPCGLTELKGKGAQETYFLTARPEGRSPLRL